MSKRQVLMILGLWVVVFLFLGFPSSWDKVFSVIAGALIIVIAYTMAPKSSGMNIKDVPFAEHRASPLPNVTPPSITPPAPMSKPAEKSAPSFRSPTTAYPSRRGDYGAGIDSIRSSGKLTSDTEDDK